MTGLFVALGIAILVLLTILLWFVPHLLQQQEQRVLNESAQLREIISEMINEQEAVAMRQVQLGSSISYLQDQMEQLGLNDSTQGQRLLTTLDPNAIQSLEARVSGLQGQFENYVHVLRQHDSQENESWFYLLNLLSAIQERLHALSQAQACGEAHDDQTGNANNNGNGNGHSWTGQHFS
jgi:hypothetical protein